MAGFVSGNAKRKEAEEFYDEFCGFPLSPPARKIRRLDADIISVLGEKEPTATLTVNHQLPTEQVTASTSMLQVMQPEMTCNLPIYPSNEEKSLVLYSSFETPPNFPVHETNVSFKVSSDLVHCIKNNFMTLQDQTPFCMDEKVAVSNNCLAIVPWVPQQSYVCDYEFAGPESRELMEAEEDEATFMEVEEERPQTSEEEVNGLQHQQWQKHCMAPHLLPNTSNPIMW